MTVFEETMEVCGLGIMVST